MDPGWKCVNCESCQELGHVCSFHAALGLFPDVNTLRDHYDCMGAE